MRVLCQAVQKWTPHLQEMLMAEPEGPGAQAQRDGTMAKHQALGEWRRVDGVLVWLLLGYLG